LNAARAIARPAIVALMGPTAAGKTDVAVAIAERCRATIVSVDSAIVYRGMDIGTAKPSRDLRARIPHRLVDIREPSERYSVAQFVADAHDAVREALVEGRLPLLVGGTMMYFNAFKSGIAAMPDVPSEVRAELAERAQSEGLAALHRELEAADPIAAAGIHPNNPQRLLRALEVYRASGRPISAWWAAQRDHGSADGLEAELVEFTLEPSRAVLNARIEARFARMLADGFIDEVRALRARGDLHRDLPSMRAVGYRQAWSHLDGEIDERTMIERALRATRQLAKRQSTWLNRWRDRRALDASRDDAAEQMLQYLEAVAILDRRS